MGDEWALRARVARYYPGLDADRLSAARLSLYDALIPRTDADEVLRSQAASLTPDGVRYYTLVATGDKAKADVAWAQAKLAEMDRKAAAR